MGQVKAAPYGARALHCFAVITCKEGPQSCTANGSGPDRLFDCKYIADSIGPLKSLAGMVPAMRPAVAQRKSQTITPGTGQGHNVSRYGRLATPKYSTGKQEGCNAGQRKGTRQGIPRQVDMGQIGAANK